MKHLQPLFHAVMLFTLATCVAETTNTATPTSPVGKKILAGIYLNQPFTDQTKDDYQGFCVDLWKEIAADLGQPFEFVPYTNLDDLLNATKQNKVDIAIGNISITHDREKIVEFSQPYLPGGLQIMIDEKRASSWERLWIGLRDSGHLKIFFHWYLSDSDWDNISDTLRETMEQGVSP